MTGVPPTKSDINDLGGCEGLSGALEELWGDFFTGCLVQGGPGHELLRPRDVVLNPSSGPLVAWADYSGGSLSGSSTSCPKLAS